MKDVFKRYELVERIGVGGMAEVYRAQGIRPDGTSTPVVVKKILPNLSGDPNFRQMFVDEARITAHLDHPNLVRLVDIGRMDEQLFLALELVEGTDLQRLLASLEAERRRLPVGDVLYVMCRVLEALEYAHTRALPDGTRLAIVHRDVSPGNVLLAHDGTVKLTDFGIAKGAVRDGHTMVGAIKGNLRYIAPEQITGGAVGPWSDTYACGMVLFRMLVGRYPIEFDALGTLVGLVVDGKVPRPREIDPALPVELDAIVAKATARDPAARFGRARDFCEALERWGREARLPLEPHGIANAVRTQLASDARALGKTVVAVIAERASDEADVSVYKSKSHDIPPAAAFAPEVVDADVEEVTRKSIVRRPRPTREMTEDQTTTDEIRPPFIRGLDESDLPVAKGEAPGGDFVVPDDLPVLKGEPPPNPFRDDEALERTKPGGVPVGSPAAAREDPSRSISREVPNLAQADSGGRREWEPDLDSLGTPVTSPPETAKAPVLASTTDSFAIPVVATPPPPLVAPPPIAEEEEGTRRSIIVRGPDESISVTRKSQTPPPRPNPDVSMPSPPVAGPPAGAAPAAQAGGASRRVLVRAGQTMAVGGFMGHKDTVSAIAIAPSSRYVVTGSHDQSVRVWDPATRREVRLLKGHEGAVTSVAIAPDGRLVASASRDKSVRVWDPISGEEAFRLVGHRDWVFSVAWSHDAKLLVTAGADRTVRVWSVNERRELLECAGHGGIVTQVRFLPAWQKQILSASYDMTLRVWSLTDGSEVRRYGTPTMEAVRALAVSPEGAYAFSAGADCHVRVWQLASGSVDAMQGHTGPVVAVSTADGNVLASGSHDGTVKIWDAGARRELKTLRGHRGSVMTLAFSPDGKYLLSGGDDRIVAIWQI